MKEYGFISGQLLIQQYNQSINFTTSMLPDEFPVFHIDLDCDFQSSDNVYPAFGKKLKPATTPTESIILTRNETTTTFSAIGDRKDNLDRCVVHRNETYTIMAVLDGHCDPEPVNYLERQMVFRLSNHAELMTDPLKVLSEVFEELERQVIENYEKGSTAIVVILIKNQLFVANLGDSKLIGIDQCGNIKDYTTCHNLSEPEQLKAVIGRGGIVLKKGSQYRINGELNLSRCFGDKHLKYCVSSKPDLYRLDATECKRWVLASDGFYNADQLDQRLKLSDFGELLKMHTFYRDNASAIFFDL